jgi:hypothetical protein
MTRSKCQTSSTQDAGEILTSSPNLINGSAAVFPSPEVPLHVPIKIVFCRINQFAVIRGVVPTVQSGVICTTCTANDDASVSSGNEVLVIPSTRAQNVRVGEIRSWFWSCDSTTDATDGNYRVLVLWEDRRGIRIGGVDNSLGFNGTSICGQSPVAVEVLT